MSGKLGGRVYAKGPSEFPLRLAPVKYVIEIFSRHGKLAYLLGPDIAEMCDGIRGPQRDAAVESAEKFLIAGRLEDKLPCAGDPVIVMFHAGSEGDTRNGVYPHFEQVSINDLGQGQRGHVIADHDPVALSEAFHPRRLQTPDEDLCVSLQVNIAQHVVSRCVVGVSFIK
jgi:hypothetical protein